MEKEYLPIICHIFLKECTNAISHGLLVEMD